MSAVLIPRQLVRIGGVPLASSVFDILGTCAANRSPKRGESSATADQVLFLWLPGGVTHHESFDPKPDAPAEVRGELTTIQTSVPGVRFSEVMPQLAKHMDKLAVIRSFAAGTNDHFLGQAFAL